MKTRLILSVSLLTFFLPGALRCAEPEWINKDFKNTTGNARNDLHWVVSGHVKGAIKETYSPPTFPGAPEIEETGPAPTTFIKWSGGTANDGDTVHVGIKVDWDQIPGARFRHASYWTQDGELKEKVSGCASANVQFGEVIEVSAANTEDPNDPPLQVEEFAYAVVNSPMALAQLTWNNPAIPWVRVSGTAIVPSAGSAHLATLPGARPGQFFIWAMAVNFSGDPPANAGHIIVQRQVSSAPIPTLSEWGLIILTLLLLAVGTLFLRRLRPRLAATT